MEDEYIYDISALDLSKRINIQKPNDYNYCVDLKSFTPARLCIGKAGARYKTETYLRSIADHAANIDAVWSEVDEALVKKLNFFTVQTLVKNKEEYITRPDIGGKFSAETTEQIKKNCVNNPDVQILVSDGLNSTAINNNIEDMFYITKDILAGDQFEIGTTIFIKYGTPAVIDEISKILNAKITILFIGERPGLAIGESISIYILFNKAAEKQRVYISNIHKNGIPPVEAGAQAAHIIETMIKE